MKHINVGDLLHFEVPFPKAKVEQTAIANALSDVDALIQELEKLIAKKQAIKTATMQQLLTGRTRLPPFALREDGTKKGYKQSELGEIPEDWEVLGFGALFQPSVSKKHIKPTSLVSFVGMQDVTEQAQLSSQHLMTIENVKSGFTYFERGDVLVAKITPCFENGKGCHAETLHTDIGFGSTEFHVLRATDNSDSRFIYYWSNRDVFRKSLESEMVGSAGHRRVPLPAIANYKIPVPLKEEQTAIATILSDMDAEIQALEQRLSKTRQIKQGMMQKLLTGKTRLIQRSESV
jgi:type I restriction enzyme S subunit